VPERLDKVMLVEVHPEAEVHGQQAVVAVLVLLEGPPGLAVLV
jgi:hypothetical protein